MTEPIDGPHGLLAETRGELRQAQARVSTLEMLLRESMGLLDQVAMHDPWHDDLEERVERVLDE